MYFRDLCLAGDVRPVNGLKRGGKCFDNDVTFIRANGRSQIDPCLTNTNGKRKLESFNIMLND